MPLSPYRGAAVPAPAGQLDLFGRGSPTPHLSFAGARRIDLDAHCWVEHVPGWVHGAEDLLALLLRQSGWEQRDRWMFDQLVTEPRLTAQFPDVTRAPAALRAVAEALTEHYAIPYDGLWLNLYRDQHDSTGWHGDRRSCRLLECVVPVLSLGATRRFLIRPRDGGRSTVLTPHSGDLVVMGGRCQRDWRHCVPKQAGAAGPRVSINFSSTRQAAA